MYFLLRLQSYHELLYYTIYAFIMDISPNIHAFIDKRDEATVLLCTLDLSFIPTRTWYQLREQNQL